MDGLQGERLDKDLPKVGEGPVALGGLTFGCIRFNLSF